jgi:hypothetical protein
MNDMRMPSRGVPAGISLEFIRQRPAASLHLFVLPALVFILRFSPGAFKDAAYILTMLYALTGRRQAVVSLLMLVLLNMATHSFGLPPSMAAIYRHLIVAAAAFSTMVLHGGGVLRTRAPSLLAWTSVLCVLLVIHSALFSQIPVLSLLKTTSFSMAILALIAGWSGLTDTDRFACETQVWGLIMALAVFSLPMLATPLGYLKGVAGFQGLTAQAQTFGPMMGLFGAVLWMRLITRRRLTLSMLILAFIAVAFVYLSQARIGAVTFIFGLAAGLGLSPLSAMVDSLRIQPRIRPGRIAAIAVIFGICLVAAGGFIYRKAANYIVKYGTAGEETDLFGAVYKARGGLMEIMLKSANENPATGIGFGVPTEGGFSTAIVYDPVFQLPIMATIEKGVMPVALLEELGYPLATIVFIWFAWLLIQAAKGGPVALAAFASSLAVNIAESCFFSPGGMGLYFLVITAWAITACRYPSADAHFSRAKPRSSLTRSTRIHTASRSHDGLLPELLART